MHAGSVPLIAEPWCSEIASWWEGGGGRVGFGGCAEEGKKGRREGGKEGKREGGKEEASRTLPRGVQRCPRSARSPRGVRSWGAGSYRRTARGTRSPADSLR
eukprot:2709125-Rhodomonas_salina.2